MAVIRTEKWLTITEAHPYHYYISDERHHGGNALVERGFDPRCSLCRKELSESGEDELKDEIRQGQLQQISDA
jgi:hypothetical protein